MCFRFDISYPTLPITGRVSASRRSSDIISMLVNIYGSKELFVNEYRTLLADRLLTHFHSATEREIRNLELLKLRFGEQQLHYCEVMLKDVADSKRINSHITDHLRKEELRAAANNQQDENKLGPQKMVTDNPVPPPPAVETPQIPAAPVQLPTTIGPATPVPSASTQHNVTSESIL